MPPSTHAHIICLKKGHRRSLPIFRTSNLFCIQWLENYRIRRNSNLFKKRDRLQNTIRQSSAKNPQLCQTSTHMASSPNQPSSHNWMPYTNPQKLTNTLGLSPKIDFFLEDSKRSRATFSISSARRYSYVFRLEKCCAL